MKKKRILKIILDLLMTILLPLLMIQALAGEELHEWIGILMFTLFIMHHILNFNWYKNLLKGKYSAVRGIGTLVNTAILICMIFIAISGVLLSKYVFAFLEVSQGISFARAAHMICTHWMFVLTSAHLGIHLNVIKNYMEQLTKRKLGTVSSRVLKILFVTITIYGVKVSIDKNLWQYMFYRVQFMFYNFSQTAFRVYLDYVSMMISFAVIGYFVPTKLRELSIAKR